MRFARTDRSWFAIWWFTVDRSLIVLLFTLMGIGLLLSAAASPTIAVKQGLEPLHFVQRHGLFVIAGSLVLVGLSFLSARAVRRLSLLVYAVGVALMVYIAMYGAEVNGARRWVFLFGQSLQPSELVKPAFVVMTAWFFSQHFDRPEMPSKISAVVTAGLFVSLLIVQPDIGQSVLIAAVWMGLFFAGGLPIRWFVFMAAMALSSLAFAYAQFPHVRSRVDRFLVPGSGDTYQTDRALQSFIEGGWFGRGPGEGTIKTILPDAHTDFIFAVIGEEYGVVACLGIVVLIGLISFRALGHVWQDPDGFRRLAVSGLIAMFALQALINIGVNVGVLPAKGMTLPFVSYGGSSFLGMSIAMGFVLALTRRRRDTGRDGNATLLADDLSAEGRSYG